MNVDKIAPALLAAIPNQVLKLAGTKRSSSGQVLDPDVNVSLKALAAGLGKDFIDAKNLDEAREIIEHESAMGAGKTIPAHTYDAEVDGVPIRIFSEAPLRPGPTTLPAIVYLHGGGWVLGSLDSHESTCRFLATRVHALVVAVGYPLAPEHRAPAAQNAVGTVIDALLDGTITVETRGSQATLEPRSWALAGDSAGGNLTATTCLDRASRDLPQPDLVMMFVPVTNLVTMETGSYREFGEGYFLTRKQMLWYKDHYVGDDEELAKACSPLLADRDLIAKLGPSYVACAGFDVLRDEGIAYAERLSEAGVQVALRVYDGLVHPFVNSFAIWSGGKVAMDEAAGALCLALGTRPNP